MISVSHCVEEMIVIILESDVFSCLDICGMTAVKGARDSPRMRDLIFRAFSRSQTKD